MQLYGMEINRLVVNYRSALPKSCGWGKPIAPKFFPVEPARRLTEAAIVSALGVEIRADDFAFVSKP